MTTAYRTTCIPKDNRLDAIIPNDPTLYDEPKYNAETLAAMQEVRDIRAGKIKTKSYATVEEMNAALDAEEDD